MASLYIFAYFYVMKRLTTLFAAVITFAASAQEMPYNPDSNGDDFVGVDDVLGVLGLYDTALMQPDLQCDYQGTDLEAFFGGIFNQEIVLDSIYVEYLYADSVETFIAGCPDPVVIETVLERSFVLTDISSNFNTSQPLVYGYLNYLGYPRRLNFFFNSNDGTYFVEYLDNEVSFLTTYSYSWWEGFYVTMPFDESWQLTEDGIEVAWQENAFLTQCQSLRIIPFWHEAE